MFSFSTLPSFCIVDELDKNLPKMESRMVSFFEYWIPHWTMLVGQRPTQDELFNKYLSRNCYVYVAILGTVCVSV